MVTPEPFAAKDRDSWSGRRQWLTEREARIVSLITEGPSNQEIADAST